MLDSEKLAEARKHQAIRFGWLKALAALAMFWACGALAFAIVIGFWLLLGNSLGKTSELWLGGVAAAAFGFILFMTQASSSRPWRATRYLKDYWRRNVQGYLLWCSRSADGVVRCEAKPREENFSPESFAIAVPFGGWFLAGCIYGSRSPWAGWRAGIEYLGPNYVQIWVRDRIGSVLKSVFVDRLLGVLAQIGSYWGFVQIIEELSGLLERTDRGRAELDERLGRAFTILDQAVERLDATKRFIKSKQAAEIRAWLGAEFLKLLPADDPRRKQFEAKPVAAKS